MSRKPQPSSLRTPGKSPSKLSSATTPRSRTPTTPTPSPRLRTKSIPSKPTPSHQSPSKEPPLPKPSISLRDAIAQKRAEAKKALAANNSPRGANIASVGSEDVDPITWNKPVEDDITELGRWPLRETIERARSSGNINLCSRDLLCLPSALFEIHLGVTPAPLKSVLSEPVLPPSDSALRRKADNNGPAWFDSHDLEILKAWNNQIIEIQPEISLFGSLKTVDLHSNQLSTLPDAFADLPALTFLNLSHNSLQCLPENFFTLPNLSTLNLSHNQLTSLPFQHPFTPENMQRLRKSNTGDFFAPEIYRADVPLPALRIIDVSFNKLSGSSIDERMPAYITKFNLSSNPLRSGSRNLFIALGRLTHLQELCCNEADLGDDAFPANLFDGQLQLYPKIRIFDVGETKVTKEALVEAFKNLGKTMNFDHTAEQPPDGVIKVIVGKMIVKEAWELEAEKGGRRKDRSLASTSGDFHSIAVSSHGKEPIKEPIKEPWEVEAEQGLLTEGGRRRARAAAAAAKEQPSTPSSMLTKESVKEVDVEEVLSAGALRLRRAKAAEAAESASGQSVSPTDGAITSLANSKYYSANTLTLSLPSSTPLSAKIGSHGRSFSVASPAFLQGSPSDLTIPTPTLPLAFIGSQPIAHTLKILELKSRRMDQSFSLPPSLEEEMLPNLELLSLEGCGLGDTIPVSSTDQAPSMPKANEALLPLLTKLFPNLLSLDLTYNFITSKSLTAEALSALILNKKKPLKHLRLRGNRITDLEGFQLLAEHFKSNREVPEWKMEELDLRDNEIGKLPAEMGLMPLDVFLVDGNLFRVPPRRVWEREGTKGLLSWLRGRLE